MLTIREAKISPVSEGGTFFVTVNKNLRGVIEALGDTVHLTIGKPLRHRSIRALNAARGWSRDIAEQLGLEPDAVYDAMKRMAVAEGYPTRLNPIDGAEEPESSANVSAEQYSKLLETIKLFADTHGLYLTEIVNGARIKTIGGAKV
jgi:hypothetical protein